jgi:hypothetical protein
MEEGGISGLPRNDGVMFKVDVIDCSVGGAF